MTTIGSSRIEYLTHAWNPVSGCHHGLDICPVSDRCWARSMAKRYRGGNFDYTWNQGAFWQRFPRRPAVIGVCFTGDLGQWVPEKAILLVQSRVWLAPQHQFLFLTKNPARYAEFNPWPDNAWLGTTITGAESAQVQGERVGALMRAKGGKKWVSYEPMMGALATSLGRLSWVVIGGWSGRHGYEGEQKRWAGEMRCEADRLQIPAWLKSNLFPRGEGVPAEYQQLPPALREPWQNWQRKEQA